jgi:hypothetical protein
MCLGLLRRGEGGSAFEGSLSVWATYHCRRALKSLPTTTCPCLLPLYTREAGEGRCNNATNEGFWLGGSRSDKALSHQQI